MKKVSFSNKIVVLPTYSSKEYNRYQIDSILYQKSINRITLEEWNKIHATLNMYKMFDMVIHPQSLKNNHYSNTF